MGNCASGKTSVVRALRWRGYEAWSVAQEHSVIPDLWERQDPDVVIYLDVSLDAVRFRRGNRSWPGWIYDAQRQRLQNARDHADLVIDTDQQNLGSVIDAIVGFLERRGHERGAGAE